MALTNLRRINRWADRSTMLRRLIAFCLLRRPLVLIAFGAFLGLGFVAFTALNIEAYPDPAPPIIEIITQRPGQSPEEMERYVTIPIEIAIASTPGLRFIRSNTVYALSFIRLQFEYGRDYYFVPQQTINRLREADLPPDDRDGRTGGQCPRRRHCEIAGGHRQYRADPGGRPSGADLRCGQNADRFHAAARHRWTRRHDRHRDRHRADAEVRAHDGRSAARTSGGGTDERRRPVAARWAYRRLL